MKFRDPRHALRVREEALEMSAAMVNGEVTLKRGQLVVLNYKYSKSDDWLDGKLPPKYRKEEDV